LSYLCIERPTADNILEVWLRIFSRKARMKLCALSCLVAALILAMVGCSLPRRSEQSIRKRLLQDTPRGTTYEAVLNYVKKQGWPVTEQPGGYEAKRFGNALPTVVGRRAIKAYLGGYQGLPWRKDVESFWAFDEHDKLIDIFVEKEADAL